MHFGKFILFTATAVLFSCNKTHENDTSTTSVYTTTSTTETSVTETGTTQTTTTATGTTTTEPQKDQPLGFNLLHVFPGDAFPLTQSPVDIAELPNGNLLILTLGGYLYRFDPKTDTMLDQYFFGELVDGELISDHVAFLIHPDFGDGTHDYIYVYRNKRIDITRHELSLDPLVVGKAQTVWEPEFGEGGGHSGGDLIWWYEDTDTPTMYASIGVSEDPSDLSDCFDLGLPACSIVALKEDPSGDLVAAFTEEPSPYKDETVVAKGLRQPWRLGDCGVGICIAHVAGAEIDEEIYLYTQIGEHFGYAIPTGDEKKYPEAKDPIWVYLDTDEEFVEQDPDNSGGLREMKVPWISQAVFSKNVFAPQLEGKIVVSDMYDGWLRTFEPTETAVISTEHIAHLRYITSMMETKDGQVYAVTGTGSLNRLVYRDDIPRVGETGMALKETSYFDEGINYQVKHPFYSNGAEKTRKLQIPEGQLIDNTDYDWVYPIGTRLWKTFYFFGQPVEVRLLELQETGWVAGTFIYEDDGQAYLSDSYNTTVPTEYGDYLVPSETACFECHGATAGEIVPLSMHPFQLGDPGLKLLRPHLMEEPDVAPIADGSSDVEQMIRGDLHSNCSFCHNPDGRSPKFSYVQLNFLFDTPLEMTQTVDRQTMYFFPEGEGPETIIAPGSGQDSALPKAIRDGYMPPIGIWEPDENFAVNLKNWIDSL